MIHVRGGEKIGKWVEVGEPRMGNLGSRKKRKRSKRKPFRFLITERLENSIVTN